MIKIQKLNGRLQHAALSLVRVNQRIISPQCSAFGFPLSAFCIPLAFRFLPQCYVLRVTSRRGVAENRKSLTFGGKRIC